MIYGGPYNTYYYHKDHLGSTRSVTDSSKNIIVAFTYHPFGETEVEEGSEQYLFNGKEKDSTGLYYYGARYYDSEIGKFIIKDLLNGVKRKSQTLNRYVYCLNNPLVFIDRWGLTGKKFSIEGGGTENEDIESRDKCTIPDSTLKIMDDLINQGMFLYAGLLGLILNGYGNNIESVQSNSKGGGTIKLKINTTEISIEVGGENDNEDGGIEDNDFLDLLNGGEGSQIVINIYI